MFPYLWFKSLKVRYQLEDPGIGGGNIKKNRIGVNSIFLAQDMDRWRALACSTKTGNVTTERLSVSQEVLF
jgi:hypothetical protein